jgi:hypothetical protein
MSRPSVPNVLPEAPDVSRGEGAAELALDLYRQLAQARRESHAALEQAEKRIDAHALGLNATIAALAAERFEFDRVLKRIEPELTALGAANAARVLDLFVRGWSAALSREGVEVRDLTGLPFTDDLAEAVDVSCAIEDASIAQPVISETLTPLVVHRGRIVGKALVNKAVPRVERESGS